VKAIEPGSQGNSIPGFGQVSRPRASILTLNETHIFGSALLNEARFGLAGAQAAANVAGDCMTNGQPQDICRAR